MIAVNGNIYTGSITSVAGSSGTQIENIEGRVIPVISKTSQRVFNAGRERDKATVIGGGSIESLMLELRPRTFDAATLDLILSPYRLTAGGYASDGAGVEGAGAIRDGVAVIVRPVDTGLYLYMPNAVLVAQPITMQYSPDAPSLDGQSIAFMATRGADSTEPAWAIGTPGQISALYSGLSAGA